MNRRGFLTGALGFLAAPAIVRASSLMPVSPFPIFTPYMGTYDGVQLIVNEYTNLRLLMTGRWHRVSPEEDVVIRRAFAGDATFAS